jgi:hypothetical protein
MRKLALALALVAAASLPAAVEAQAQKGGWPSVAAQLRRDGVAPGSALAQLIADHQDIALLRPEEAHDRLPLPLWLRVLWRRSHPETEYDPADPTGGYPRALAEIHDWMVRHQDLRAAPEAAGATQEKTARPDTNVRISGERRVPRSESDLRINYWDPRKVIAASNNLGFGGQAQFYSTDGGATWNNTTLPFVQGDVFHSDPTVDWTSDGTAWATTIGVGFELGPPVRLFLRLRSYRSRDFGATWTFDDTFSGQQTGADKQMVWADHASVSPYGDSLYAIWHEFRPVYMNRRTPDGGWGSPLQVSGAETKGTGLGADVKTNAAGDVFGFWPDTGSRRIWLVRSTDGGQSYRPPRAITATFGAFVVWIPAQNLRDALIYVSGGAYRSGARSFVYAAWTDLTGARGCRAPGNEPKNNTASACKTRIWFARSIDGGATWSRPRMVNNRPEKSDQFNQALAVDEATGALGLIYYDTVADPQRKRADVWYQASYDAGATWSAAVKVTTAPSDETADEADWNQYGDYNGLSGYAGLFLPSWTDRRDGGPEEIWTAAIVDLRTARASGAWSEAIGGDGAEVCAAGEAAPDPMFPGALLVDACHP